MSQSIIKKNNEENIDISLGEILFKINRWKSFISLNRKYFIFSIIVGLLIGFIYSKFEKTTYKASLTFVIDEDKGGIGGGAMGIASQLFDIGGSATSVFSGPNLLDLIKSKLIVESTLLTKTEYKGKYITLLEFYYKIYENKEPLKLNDFSSRGQDSILNSVYKKIIKNNLKVEQKDKKINILSIEFNSYDEIFSKSFCENIAKEVSDFYIVTKSKKAKNNVDILQKQVDSIRKELNNSIYGVASNTDNVYNLNPALNVRRIQVSKNQVDVQANTAILTQIVANLELAKVSLRKETPLIQVIDSPKLPLDSQKISLFSACLISSFVMLFFTFIILLIYNFSNKIIAENSFNSNS
jgi:hypothetical protein